MDGRETEGLEEKVGELERLADALEGVPDEDLAGALGRAVELLGEINAGIEARLISSEEEARELGTLLDGVDFSSFDAALEDLEERSVSDETGP
jgi:hypothetical protein